MKDFVEEIGIVFFSNQCPKYFCQICGKQGHTGTTYYYRFDTKFQQQSGSNMSQSPTALLAFSPAMPYPSWYLYTGASNHVTLDLYALSLQSPYNGPTKVSVAMVKPFLFTIPT